MKTNLKPIAAGERIVILDVLRGLAIFGILMVNMQLFYQPMTIMLLGFQPHESLVSNVAELFIKFFFEGKFYVLFSMLFGYGFYIFINKSREDNQPVLPVFRRRLAVLLLFGVLHVVLLWPGDILVYYALFGFLLILFRNKSDKGLIRWAIGFGLFPVILTALMAALLGFALSIPEVGPGIKAGFAESMAVTRQMVEQAAAAYSSGSFSELVNARLMEYQAMTGGILFFYPVVMAMFLMGYWLARKGYLLDIQANITFFRRCFIWGVLLGIPLNALYSFAYTRSLMQQMDAWTVLSNGGHVLGGFFLSMAYSSGLVLLFARGRLQVFSRLLAPVGRMALTNYLLHSLICGFIFLPYGLGLFGRINPWQGILLTIVIFGLQIPFSHWWLKQFRFGPVEWIWRSLTYGKMPPFRKPVA